MNILWTDEQIERLQQLWNEGYSYASIAEQIGVSRNAAIGKGSRLGLKNGDQPKTERVRSRTEQERIDRRDHDRALRLKKRAEREAERLLRHPPPLPVNIIHSSSHCTLLALGNSNNPRCRFPIDADPLLTATDVFRYCGERATCGSYCRAHHVVTHEQRNRPMNNSGFLFYAKVGRKQDDNTAARMLGTREWQS